MAHVNNVSAYSVNQNKSNVCQELFEALGYGSEQSRQTSFAVQNLHSTHEQRKRQWVYGREEDG